MWKTDRYKTQETDKFGKSNMMKISNYETLQTNNCDKTAYFIKNNS